MLNYKVGCDFNHFTPKSDQYQISPAASPEILYHIVWRTWLFIAYSDERWLYCQFSLPHLIHFLLKGWENVQLGSEGVKHSRCELIELSVTQALHALSSILANNRQSFWWDWGYQCYSVLSVKFCLQNFWRLRNSRIRTWNLNFRYCTSLDARTAWGNFLLTLRGVGQKFSNWPYDIRTDLW